MVLLGGVQQSRIGPNAVLALAPAQWVGKLSYSLYLWHWPVIVYAAMLVPELTAAYLPACGSDLRAVAVQLSFRRESDTQEWLARRRPARSLGFAALITTTGAAVAYASASLGTRNLGVDPRQRMIAESAERLSIGGGTDPTCVADFVTVKPKPCVFGATSSNETVVLFGNSHADHWSTPLVAIARKDNFPSRDLHEIIVPGDTDHDARLEFEANLYRMRRLEGARAQSDHRDEAEDGHHLPVLDNQYFSRSC